MDEEADPADGAVVEAAAAEPRDAATIADKAAAALEPELMACLNASIPAFDVELDIVYVVYLEIICKVVR